MPPWFAKQHPARRLARLLGTWKVEATFPNGDIIHGTTTFTWLADNGLMTMRSKMRRLIPSSVAILGADDVLDQLTMLYADDRGVTRRYEMELTRTSLAFHRKAPRFHQRFVSTITRNAIRGAWQTSPTGRRWQHDFDIVYTRQR